MLLLKGDGASKQSLPKSSGLSGYGAVPAVCCRVPALVVSVRSHAYKVTMVDGLVGFSPGQLQFGFVP